jgi:hypothetical protein
VEDGRAVVSLPVPLSTKRAPSRSNGAGASRWPHSADRVVVPVLGAMGTPRTVRKLRNHNDGGLERVHHRSFPRLVRFDGSPVTSLSVGRVLGRRLCPARAVGQVDKGDYQQEGGDESQRHTIGECVGLRFDERVPDEDGRDQRHGEHDAESTEAPWEGAP